MKIARRFLLALAAAALAAGPAAAEDMTIVSKVTFGKKEATSTQYMTSERTRTSDGQFDTIVEFASGKFWGIDHKKKQYWETSLEEMAAFMKKMTDSLKGSPMESLFGTVTEVDVKKGEGKRQIAGYDCVPWTLSMGDMLVFDLWVAPSLHPPTPKYIESFRARAATMGPMGEKFARMYEEMAKIEGYPLATEMNMKSIVGKQETVQEAIEVRKGPVAASVFELPAGYKKVKSPYQE